MWEVSAEVTLVVSGASSAWTDPAVGGEGVRVPESPRSAARCQEHSSLYPFSTGSRRAPYVINMSLKMGEPS